jgi:putative peptide zinc metalloprotease protein
VLARLENPEVVRELARLQGREQVLQQELASLIARDAIVEPGGREDPASRIPTVREALADVRGQQERFRQQVRQLRVTAPLAGTVLPPPSRRAAGSVDATSGELPGWTGSPLDAENRGAFLDRGTLLCQIGDPRRMEAALIVAQRDIRLVQPGQTVRLRFHQSPRQLETANVNEVARLDVQALPEAFVAAGVVPYRQETGGGRTLDDVYYLVRVALDATPAARSADGLGRASIHAPPRSAVRRIYEWACGTFRFLP